MTDEAKALVERLRWGAWYYEDPFDGKAYASDDPLEAADLIETQAREIERLGVIAQGNASIVCKILDEKDAELAKFKALAETLAGALEEAAYSVGMSSYDRHKVADKALLQYKEAHDAS